MKVFMATHMTLLLVLLVSFASSANTGTNQEAANLIEASQDQPSGERSDTDLVLRRFVIEATVPQRGINCLSLHGMPTSTVFMLMQLASEKEQVAREIKLDDSQLDSFDIAWASVDVQKWDFYDVDEATAEPRLYEMLSKDQRRMLELIALSIDGVSSLPRTFFVEELELSEEQVSRMKKFMAELRSTQVKRIFQTTFAGPSNSTGYGQIVGWEHTKVAAACNREIIAMLNQRQRDCLAQLVTEAEEYNELRAQIVLEIFYPKSRPFEK